LVNVLYAFSVKLLVVVGFSELPLAWPLSSFFYLLLLGRSITCLQPAAAVGRSGSVLAVDPEPNMVAYLRARAEREHTDNVVPILASADNPRLPVAGVDVVLIVDTYHHLDDRLSYLRGLQRLLRSRGRVAVIDWHKRELPVGPPLEHKLAREQVVEEMTAAGYRLVAELDFLPYQYFLIFAPR